ncbi:uncharacterized protein L969DRAFT_16713 [Mixia osmundae IAM 14324]|nr:uncharacterized protein L969DRAFT_16713 [Mixia osmundae IAM 14324]KEI40040.1 hypothetical protein L969DRAFT_16713 [Mixia osmundae IAM 14324]
MMMLVSSATVTPVPQALELAPTWSHRHHTSSPSQRSSSSSSQHSRTSQRDRFIKLEATEHPMRTGTVMLDTLSPTSAPSEDVQNLRASKRKGNVELPVPFRTPTSSQTASAQSTDKVSRQASAAVVTPGKRRRVSVARLDNVSTSLDDESTQGSGQGLGSQVSPTITLVASPSFPTSAHSQAARKLSLGGNNQSEPVSPIVLSFDPTSVAGDAQAVEQMQKSLALRKEQQALIESRQRDSLGNSSRAGPPSTASLRRTASVSNDTSVSYGPLASRRGTIAREKARNLTIRTNARDAHLPQIKSAPLQVPRGYGNEETYVPIARTAVGSQAAGPLTAALASSRDFFERRNHLASLAQSQIDERDLPSIAHFRHHADERMLSPRSSLSQSTASYLPSISQPHPQNHSHSSARTSESSEVSSRRAFMSHFEGFYDTINNSRVLQATLDDQIRKSTTLLSDLQGSSAAFEGMLERRMSDLCKTVTADLQLLENRIDKLERSISDGDIGRTERTATLGERLTRLERTFLEPLKSASAVYTTSSLRSTGQHEQQRSP